MVNALRGGACKPSSPVVTAMDLYNYLHSYVSKTTDRLNLTAASEYNPESGQPAPVPMHQTPVMFSPAGHADMVTNPICMRCEPPSAPERPYVSSIFMSSSWPRYFSTCLYLVTTSRRLFALVTTKLCLSGTTLHSMGSCHQSIKLR